MIRNFLHSAFLLLTASFAMANGPDTPHLINQEHLVNLPYETDAKQYDRAIMERIFREPCVEIRRAVLAGYMAQFRYFNPALLADARALDGRLETDQVTADVLEVMAEISPTAAFGVLRTLLKTIQPVERFTDSWDQEFEAINLENISGAPTWLGSPAAAVGFLNGLDRSKEDPETKANLKIRLVTTWDRYFGETKEFDVTPESEKPEPNNGYYPYHSLAESRAEILPLFTQIASQMKPAMKRGAMLNYKEMVLCAMIRWLYMEPESGELILACLPD